MVVKGGVCVRHGANRKRKPCSREGCTNIAQKGGVCKTHHVINGEVCRKHGPKGRRELDEVKSALTNHTSALLRLPYCDKQTPRVKSASLHYSLILYERRL
eukprot:scaffold1712_cov86-Skeletonema_marinoi.AAC.5